MANIFINGQKLLTSQDLPTGKTDIPNSWQSGGAGIDNSHIVLYVNNHRIRNLFFEIEKQKEYTLGFNNISTDVLGAQLWISNGKDFNSETINPFGEGWIDIHTNPILNFSSANYDYASIVIRGNNLHPQNVSKLFTLNLSFETTLNDLANEINILKNKMGG